MDRVEDGGVEWRRQLRYQHDDLKIVWLDPTDKPIDLGVEDNESRERRRQAKALGQYDTVTNEINPIRRVDLRMVDISDWLAVNIDLDVHACGTLEEVFLANRQKKPILVHIEQGKCNAPDWLFATIPHQLIFDNWFQMGDYIRHIANDPVIDTLNRWMFFDFHGENLDNYEDYT
jgi:hypothetical protein